MPCPPVEQFAAVVGLAAPDASWAAWWAACGGRPDLAVAEHRAALLRWLNAWGCRIRLAREGEADVFGESLAAWRPRLPSRRARLARLTDTQVERVAAAYGELAALPAAVGRTFGPTAASKALFALRPAAVLPWDAGIALALWGGRDVEAFARHQRLGRAWAVELGPALGVPGLIDRYLWRTYVG